MRGVLDRGVRSTYKRGRRRMRTILVVAAFGVVLLPLLAQQYGVRNVVTHLDTPWEILWGPDGWIWMTERWGRVSRVHPETGELQVLTVIEDVVEIAESGLMGMALHPNFADTPLVYLVYTYRSSDLRFWNKVVAYRYTGDSLRYEATLLDSLQGWRIHDGARLWILPDRTLLITMGDAGTKENSQDLSNGNGKLLRIRLDGTIPPDNPFPNSPVYAYGLRNSQGLVVVNGQIYVSDHGPASDDEVNRILKGRNYGWPYVMGWCDEPDEQQFCTEHQVVEPMAAWTPTLAVCGLDFYRGNKFPEWNNSLLLVTLKAARVVQLQLNAAGDSIVQEKHYFVRQFGRLRDLCISPDGRVFFATSNRDGRGRNPFPLPEDDRIIEILPAVNSKEEGQLEYRWELRPQHRALEMWVRELPPFGAELCLYNAVGQLLWRRQVRSPQRIRVPVATPGLYVCQLRLVNGDAEVRWVLVY